MSDELARELIGEIKRLNNLLIPLSYQHALALTLGYGETEIQDSAVEVIINNGVKLVEQIAINENLGHIRMVDT